MHAIILVLLDRVLAERLATHDPADMEVLETAGLIQMRNMDRLDTDVGCAKGGCKPEVACSEGMVWNSCGGCDRTCENPNPTCIEVCMPKCECPADIPFVDNGRCVLEAECTILLQPAGTNDLEGYQKVAKAFVGVNPRVNQGSGFLMGGANSLNQGTFGQMPDSNTGRNDLCTCDCEAGHDGIGCSGWGGIRFRYNSMLWTDPFTRAWTGQMEAWQPKDESKEGKFGTEFHFIGNDMRRYPGGPAIYNVACTQGECRLFSGTFRQSNGPVKCSAALAEDVSLSTSCYNRCVTKGKSPLYQEWLDYCKADTENTTSGFSGYGK